MKKKPDYIVFDEKAKNMMLQLENFQQAECASATLK